MSSQRTHRRILPLLVAVLLGLTGAVVQLPQTAAAEGHPYTTPGQREYNGRMWNTTCEEYSSTAERCRAEILATQVKLIAGKYQFVNEYVFNNLTYLPSNRDNWKDNPLGKTDQFIQDGRMWQTSCFDEWTGKNGCRSFIFASVIEPTKTATGWSFAKVDKWLFNNVVQFTPAVSTPPPTPLNPCNVPAPAGWTFTAQGRPHLIKPGYEPTDHYNPISLANFMKLAMRHPVVPEGNAGPGEWTRADQLCFALLGANELLKKDETRTYEGKKSLWFPYPFSFSANPAVDDLPIDWNSGLGQAGAMMSMLELSTFVGEPAKPVSERPWENVAKQIYNSYLIPLEKGGFTNRQNGFLWFEEYPTTPEPTVVNNGHHQNVLGLYAYWQHTKDPEALALFEEAVTDLDAQTIKAEVPLEGGIMSSYDLLRGYAATPLRAVVPSGDVSGTKITGTLLNGQPLTAYPDNKPFHSKNTQPATLPLQAPTAGAGNFVDNPDMSNPVNKVPTGWRAVNGNTGTLRGPDADGMIGVHPDAKSGWAGLEQTVPASTWTGSATPGSLLSFAMDSRLEIDAGTSGTGGKVAIYSVCPAPGGKTTTALIHENPKNRSRKVAWSTSDFKAPAGNCDIKIQLLTYSYAVNNTTAWYKNITLRQADPLGPNVAPAYDLLVHKAPTSTLTIKGSGNVAVQAYYGGRWLTFAEGELTAAGLKVTVPERYTGRNINYNYHDGHIAELQLIACYARAQSLDPVAARLDGIAKRWSATATRPYKDFSQDVRCATNIDRVVYVNDEPMFVDAEPDVMSEVPTIMPTTMALPEDLAPAAADTEGS